MLSKKRENEIAKLFECLEQIHKVKKEELLSKSRKKECVNARRDFMNILFESFESEIEKHSEITNLINRSRLTFIHHRKKHVAFYGKYKDYKQEYDIIKSKYLESLAL